MGGVAQSVSNDVSNAISAVGQVGQAIINNPLPVIETVALTTALGPEGAALADTIGAPATAAVSSAAVAAANGGNVQQIADAAAGGAVGSEVSSLVSQGTSPIQGAASGSTSPLAAAAGGAAGGATQAALSGQNVGQAALTGGAVGGLASAGAQEASSLLSPGTMSGTGLSAQPSTGSSLDLVNAPTTVTDPTTGEQIPVADSTTGASLGSKLNVLGQSMIPTDGGLGIVGDPNAILPASLSEYATPSSQMRLSSDGTLIPAYESGASTITPEEFAQYNLPGEETPAETITSEPQTIPGLSKEAQDALQSVLGFGLNALFSPKATGLGGVGASTTGSSASTGTTSSTTGGAPGGTELDPSTGKAPESVWGDKYSSLKEGLNL
jgi:hypothetical protein